MKKAKPSARSIERLSLYHRVLAERGSYWGASVFSHELAQACQLTPAQVRRDLMVVGYCGNPNRGYDVRCLLDSIAEYIDPAAPRLVAIVGMGRMGRAISQFLEGRTRKLRLAAAFDTDPSKIGVVFSGIPCFGIERMPEIVRKKRIEIGILAVPAAHAQTAAMQLAAAGVTGLLNFAPAVLHLPSRIYAESIDMSVALEKVAFFARPSRQLRRSAHSTPPRMAVAV